MSIDKVLILDFGSQFTQLIARRVRSLNIYCEIMPCNIDESVISNFKPKAIILSGGGESVTDEYAPKVPHIIYSLKIPILGICYGQQYLAQDFGCKIISGKARTYGLSKLTVLANDSLFENIWEKGDTAEVWMSHGDCIIELADDFEVLAETENAPYAVIKHIDKDMYGFQFHPEVYHTSSGTELLRNFLVGIANLSQKWQMNDFITEAIHKIRAQVGNEKVVLGLSGGLTLLLWQLSYKKP